MAVIYYDDKMKNWETIFLVPHYFTSQCSKLLYKPIAAVPAGPAGHKEAHSMTDQSV